MATKIVLVDCISQFRTRYAVELDENEPSEYALDDIATRLGDDGFKEFSQIHLGEMTISHREMTLDEAIKVAREDNSPIGRTWSDDQIVKCYINTTK